MNGIPEPSLMPPEPHGCRRCLWCGGELYGGNAAFRGSAGTVHPECMGALLLDKPGLPYLAAICGFREVIL